MAGKDENNGASQEENTDARSSQEAEMKKLGLKPHSERVKGKESAEDEDEEDQDEDTEEEEEEQDEEESEEEDDDSEDEEDEQEDEDEEDEEEEEDEKSQSHKKKGISFKQFNQLRSDLRETRRLLAEKNKKGDDSEVTTDFLQRTEELAKEIGIENPEGLKKIMGLVEEAIKGTSTNFEKKLADLEKKYGKFMESAPMEDNFSGEWKSFLKSDFKKEFPDASSEELEEAQELMNELSHDRKTGGKVYKNEDGQEVLDPYPLDYIFFKNKDKFEGIIGGKKVRGMESSRTQGFRKGQDKEENKPLRKGASAKEIQEYEKRSARAMDSMDNLSEPVDDTI